MSVVFEVQRQVARVTIDRPERLNAVDTATEARLQAIWQELEARDDIRCVVLTGAGERAFSAGADMKEAGAKSGLAYWAEDRPGGFGGIALRTTLDIPVIARVNGLALGGGFEMVLGCDIVVACEEAEFGLQHGRAVPGALAGVEPDHGEFLVEEGEGVSAGDPQPQVVILDGVAGHVGVEPARATSPDHHQVRGDRVPAGAHHVDAVARGTELTDAGLQAEAHAGVLVGLQVEA